MLSASMSGVVAVRIPTFNQRTLTALTPTANDIAASFVLRRSSSAISLARAALPLVICVPPEEFAVLRQL